MSPRHRDSPRVRRLARAAGVDLARVRPSGAHGRATAADLARAAVPEAPVPAAAAGPVAAPSPAGALVGAPSGSLLEVDVTALLRDVGPGAAAPSRARLLATVAGSLARAAAAARPAGLPAGPVAVRLADDDGRVAVLDDADLLSVDGLVARVAAAAGDVVAGDRPAPVVDVVGTAGSGTTVDLRPPRPGVLALLSVGPVLRRPVVVLGADGDEQIGIRSMAWLALSAAGLDPDVAAGLLARVGHDLSRPTGAGR